LLSVSGHYASKIRVYYEDTDAGGVVYHANYLKFMERCRSDWLATKGCKPQQPTDEWGVILAVRSLQLEYFRPARLGDLLEVSVIPESIGGASVFLSQTISGEKGLLAEGRFKIACLDVKSFKPCRIPDELKRKIS